MEDLKKYDKNEIREYLNYLLLSKIKTMDNLVIFLNELLNSISDIIDKNDKLIDGELESINDNEQYFFHENDGNILICLSMDGFKKLKLEKLLNKFLDIEFNEIENSIGCVNNLMSFIKKMIHNIYSILNSSEELDENELRNFCFDYFKKRNISEFTTFSKELL
jgi:hypothetical protein